MSPIPKINSPEEVLRNFVNSEWGRRFKTDEDINGADFVDYGYYLYWEAKRALKALERKNGKQS